MTLRPGQVAADAVAAAARIADTIRETPLRRNDAFAKATGADVYFKFENLQHTGSFKLRGASNCLHCLGATRRAKGVVAASSGNHGAALAFAMRRLDVGGVIFVPEATSSAKVDAIRRYGGEVRFFGNDGLETELHARAFAEENGMYYVSPYNDPTVIAGQGSCGVEILKQLPDVDAAFIAVGGGGLLGGVGSVLKQQRPEMALYACQPAASAVMTKSIEAGRILDLPSESTLSDGTAGGVEPGAITFELCRDLCDDYVLVTEAEIADAMRRYLETEESAIEGAAGVALAAMLARKNSIAGQKVVVIICGGNIADATLQRVLAGP